MNFKFANRGGLSSVRSRDCPSARDRSSSALMACFSSRSWPTWGGTAARRRSRYRPARYAPPSHFPVRPPDGSPDHTNRRPSGHRHLWDAFWPRSDCRRHGLWVFVILMGLAGAASTIQSPLPYAKAIAAWFDHRRGLALGIAMAGVGLGGFVVPQVTRAAIDGFGWRGAYAVLGTLTVVVAFPAVALWVREPLPRRGRAACRHRPRPRPDGARGPTDRPLLASGRYVSLVALGIVGMQAHIVPLLTDHGLSPALAAATLGTLGSRPWLAVFWSDIWSTEFMRRTSPPCSSSHLSWGSRCSPPPPDLRRRWALC